MIEVYSFEEWDALQDHGKTVEWGNYSEAAGATSHSSVYADVPLEIREMFYIQYISHLTNPKKQ
jgi:hypothetical protein